MIDCYKSIERKDLRKVVKRKKSVRGERIRREENRGVKTFLLLAGPLASA